MPKSKFRKWHRGRKAQDLIDNVARFLRLYDTAGLSHVELKQLLREAWEIECEVQIIEEAERAARGLRSRKTRELVASGLKSSGADTYERLMQRGVHGSSQARSASYAELMQQGLKKPPD